jgi:hypothetical protein
MDKHDVHMGLHEFAQRMIAKHAELLNWTNNERFNWCDEIDEYIATKEAPDAK